MSAEEVAKALDKSEAVEDVFKLLEYLAANKRILRTKLLPLTQSTYSIRRKQVSE